MHIRVLHQVPLHSPAHVPGNRCSPPLAKRPERAEGRVAAGRGEQCGEGELELLVRDPKERDERPDRGAADRPDPESRQQSDLAVGETVI